MSSLAVLRPLFVDWEPLFSNPQAQQAINCAGLQILLPMDITYSLLRDGFQATTEKTALLVLTSLFLPTLLSRLHSMSPYKPIRPLTPDRIVVIMIASIIRFGGITRNGGLSPLCIGLHLLSSTMIHRSASLRPDRTVEIAAGLLVGIAWIALFTPLSLVRS